MLSTIWHCFSGQFLMLFQMVCSVLLTVLHLKTLLLTTNQDPTNNVDFNANTKSKMEHTKAH